MSSYIDNLKQALEEAKNPMITCCKCHGEGTYRVPILDDNGEWGYEWESCKCEVCKGTGKITLQFYKDLQRGYMTNDYRTIIQMGKEKQS